MRLVIHVGIKFCRSLDEPMDLLKFDVYLQIFFLKNVYLKTQVTMK